MSLMSDGVKMFGNVKKNFITVFFFPVIEIVSITHLARYRIIQAKAELEIRTIFFF